MGFAEGAQAFVEPLTKLVDHTANAIGVWYEPKRIVRKAEADAKRIELLSNAMTNANVPVVISGDEMSLDSSSFEELCKRTGYRLAYQELSKQQNIEAVLDKTYMGLENEPPVTAEPIDTGWMSRFFDSAGEVSNEDMQDLWASVLAGEVKQPGSFSLRTLDILRNLSTSDAQLFESLAQYILWGGSIPFLYNDVTIRDKYNIKPSHILQLEECGLLATSTELRMTVSLSDIKPSMVFRTDKYLCFARKASNDILNLYCHTFSSAGNELYNIVNSTSNVDFIYDVTRSIASHNVGITLHKIHSTNAEKIEYEDGPIDLQGNTGL